MSVAGTAAHIIVVTGGNKGIGYATVKALCESTDSSNAVVYLTARSAERGTEALQKLKKEGLNPVFHQLDVDDASSITTFADYIKKEHGGLDVLVNNAGMAFHSSSPESFAVQAETTIRVNYSGLQAVCHAFFPLLRSHARVVNVSSALGHLSRVPGAELRKTLASPDLTEQQLDNIMAEFVKAAREDRCESVGWATNAYVASKVGVSAITRLQQKQLDADATRQDIVVNCCHPGYVATDMTASMKVPGQVTIERGAMAPTYLALLSPNCDTPRGAYVWHDKKEIDWVNGQLPAPGY